MKEVFINSRLIGAGAPVYIVAELSGNHHQDFDEAVALVRAAKEAGADAVKIQTYTPDTLTIDCDLEHFRIGDQTIWRGRTLYDLYREAQTPWEWQPRLQRAALDLGLDFFSTPFDASAVEFLERMKVPAYKVASFEIVDLPLIRLISSKGKPVILSTGMATLAEIDEAIRTATTGGAQSVALLKCTSAYPADAGEANLRTIRHLEAIFRVPIGLSDHTMGTTVPVVSVAMGAAIVEKHLTLSRAAGGPDGAFSLEPAEFKDLVQAIRIAEKAMGEVAFGVTLAEESSMVFRRSLFVVKHMRKGEVFTEANVRSIRPGYGLPPKFLESVMGRKAACAISRGTPLSWSLIGSD